MDSDLNALKAGLLDARKALQENTRLLDPEKNKVAHNWNIALAAMLQSQARIQNDLELLHRKLQPILKHLEEENSDWRSRYPNYEGG